MRSMSLSSAALWAAMALAGAESALAQTASLAPGQVSGAELQAWVDADGLALGGVGLEDKCRFFAQSRGLDRYVGGLCPGNFAPWVVKGVGKVVGNSWCVKFSYPDGSSTDGCEEFFKMADSSLEIRRGGKPVYRVYRLTP